MDYLTKNLFTQKKILWKIANHNSRYNDTLKKTKEFFNSITAVKFFPLDDAANIIFGCGNQFYLKLKLKKLSKHKPLEIISK
jgi:hypothetical protein